VRPAAPVLLRVLGDVEKVREVAERAHDVERLVDRQGIELRLQVRLDGGGLPGGLRVRFRAPEPDCRLPDALDALARVRAHLLADHVAQQPSEEPTVFAKLLFLVVGQVQNRSTQGRSSISQAQALLCWR